MEGCGQKAAQARASCGRPPNVRQLLRRRHKRCETAPFLAAIPVASSTLRGTSAFLLALLSPERHTAACAREPSIRDSQGIKGADSADAPAGVCSQGERAMPTRIRNPGRHYAIDSSITLFAAASESSKLHGRSGSECFLPETWPASLAGFLFPAGAIHAASAWESSGSRSPQVINCIRFT
jgi:hypothetical protein